VLYIIYPRAGGMELPFASQFNHWSDALLAMVNLGFIGDGVEVRLIVEDFFFLSLWQRIDLVRRSISHSGGRGSTWCVALLVIVVAEDRLGASLY
jgi:hypothetical protein